MKRLLFCLGLFIFMAGALTSRAQSVIDAEDDNNFSLFYTKTLTKEKRAMPYASLRENDIVWERWVWRTIDFREKFNQFLYFPIYKTDNPAVNSQGRKSLTRTIMEAFESGAIEAYKDDDMLIPYDFEAMSSVINRTRLQHIPEFDEFGDELEGRDTLISEEFRPEDVYSCKLKESWYIDKQDTRQKVRITGLALVYNYCLDRPDGERTCDPVELFWIPMQDMRVRNVLVTSNCYDERNTMSTRTYDDVFITRYFDSFITRESNTYNRPIGSFLTGTDAILESQRIEDDLANIESDMWEY